MSVKFNKEEFFNCYKTLFGKLNEKKVKALSFLLDKLDETKRIDSIPKKAYVLATIKWETADTFEPITEYGSEKYLKSKKYYPFIGRGYVQLTWEANYKKFGDFLKIDLLNFPHKANDPEIAWKILEEGMTDDFGIQDPNFTKYTLEDYFSSNNKNYFSARMIINPKDHNSFNPIAEMAMNFEKCLSRAILTEGDIPEEKGFIFNKS